MSGNGEKAWLKHTFWTIVWALLLGGYGWTTYTGSALAKDLKEITVEHKNDIIALQKEDKELKSLIYVNITPMREDIAAIKANLGIKTKQSSNYTYGE